MFVIQRVLEVSGQADAARPEPRHPSAQPFPPVLDRQHGRPRRHDGLYHGTQQINQGQMDRWSIVTTLNYLPHDKESDRPSKAKAYQTPEGREHRRHKMVPRRRPHAFGLHQRRHLDRDEPAHGHHLGRERRDLRRSAAFRVTFLNKCDEMERATVAEFYQRCFGEELPESAAKVMVAWDRGRSGRIRLRPGFPRSTDGPASPVARRSFGERRPLRHGRRHRHAQQNDARDSQIGLLRGDLAQILVEGDADPRVGPTASPQHLGIVDARSCFGDLQDVVSQRSQLGDQRQRHILVGETHLGRRWDRRAPTSRCRAHRRCTR